MQGGKTMRIEIVERNCKASDKLREVLEKKVSRLDKYFDDEALCRICLKEEKLGKKMEISIFYHSEIIRAEVIDEEFYNDIDLILPKIEKQIYRHKSKISSKLKKDAFQEKQLFAFGEEDLKENKLVKTKNFEMLPMSVNEAIEQLDLLGHNFFVFLDKQSDDIRVIYRRDSGDIGMIVPLIAK